MLRHVHSPHQPASHGYKPYPATRGNAMFFYNYSTWRSAPGIYLEDLFVRPEQRGKGYGLALLRRLAAEVTKVGGKRLEWSVLRWNEPSIKFYTSESVGAKGLEEWMKMMVDGEALTKLAAADRSLVVG
ncbi:hypothetical protein ACJ73_04081 [Blastomyces percursus]|uniref:N-acetyltransferase domain-containing protein n=1 Tax=Blastomyces percursus TaxID=1658174 RepID=A0A1J9Q922_9EURO|nr:hypothetical protein ACJ73_04081 [Blastomyces percursus]